MFRFFEHLVDPYCPYEEKDTPPQTLFGFLWDYSQPFKLVFLITGLTSIFAAVGELLLIYAVGWLVDIMSGDPATVLRENVWILVGLFFFVMIVRPLVHFIDVALINNTIMTNLPTLIRWRAHRHVLRQSVGWFENDFAGRIANRVMQTPPAAGSLAFQMFDALSYSSAYLVGAIVLMATTEALLALPLVLWAVGYFALIRWTVTRIIPASQAFSNARSEFNGRVVDAYTNIHSVKLFSHESNEMEYARDAIENTRTTFQKEMRIYTKMDLMLLILNGLLTVSVIGWAIYLWANGTSSAGIVAAAAALVLRLSAMTGWIMWALTTFFSELGIVAEGMESIAEPIALVDDPQAVPLLLTQGAIAVEGLSHHYGRDQGGLDKLSLSIKAGERVGIVGRSGAGKSTLVKLLLRFYDAETGRISIDDQDITRVTQASLRAAIGMVQQENALLHRSIRENIAYGHENASDEAIIAAAQKAQAHEFILDLHDSDGNVGYDARVGERGVKLSGGQRQRIALARVILKDAPILVLDEATSALDSEVEAAIQDTLYGMMQGKTVIAIAHRLSTIAQMDRILVMDNGRLAEEGTHDALLAKGGLYAGFWARQSGGFIDVEGQA
jgi:ATP-binding cassette subfamily B multidrug efflux pump